MIFIYTNNRMVISAIEYLANEIGYEKIYFFYDKISLLTCASLLSEALVIVDSVNEINYSDSKWFVFNIKKRRLLNDFYFIVNDVVNISIISVDILIEDVEQLRKILIKLKCKQTDTARIPLKRLLLEKLSLQLRPSYLYFIKHEVNEEAGRRIYQKKYGAKAYYNKRYQLQKILSLSNRVEYFKLINKIKNE